MMMSKLSFFAVRLLKGKDNNSRKILLSVGKLIRRLKLGYYYWLFLVSLLIWLWEIFAR